MIFEDMNKIYFIFLFFTNLQKIYFIKFILVTIQFNFQA